MKKLLVLLLMVFGITMMATPSDAHAEELTTIEQLQKTVESKVRAFEKKFTVTYTGDMNAFKANVGKIIPNFIEKNIEYSGYITKSAYSYLIKSDTAEVTYTVTFVGTKEQYDFVDTKVKAIAKNIAASHKTEYAKVKAVNDYLVLNTEYKVLSDRSHYSSYGVFKHQKAVCQGYAIAAHQLFKELNIQSQYVTGTAKGQAHAWNKVKIDGKWYNLDITWNDPVPNEPNQVRYNYFLLSDKAMSATHKWNAANFEKATSTTYDFFKNTLYATQINNDVYYANKADNGRLYKFSINTQKNAKLSNARPMYIQSYKNVLYFSDYANSGFLTSANLQGKAPKVLAKSNVKHLVFKNNILNYQINSSNKTFAVK